MKLSNKLEWPDQEAECLDAGNVQRITQVFILLLDNLCHSAAVLSIVSLVLETMVNELLA